eukprot:gene14181-20148_t
MVCALPSLCNALLGDALGRGTQRKSHSYDPPSWAVLGAWEIAKAAAVAAGKNLTPPADADLSWVLQVPDLIPHLSVPAVLGALDIENGPLTMGKARHSESTGKNPPVDASAIVKCVLDVDEADIPRHLREVSDALRAEVEQNSLSTHVVATKRSNNRLQPHARMLFHHPPYNMQEEVNLCEADVTIVVEASQAGAAADSPSWQTRYDSDGLGQLTSLDGPLPPSPPYVAAHVMKWMKLSTQAPTAHLTPPLCGSPQMK